jgi:2-dehydro-3-deoxy-D-gluconate 5-dehydrogenase
LILEGFKITGKNALVTGSDKGLGAAIALALAEAGANVAIHGRTSDDNNVSDQIRKLGRDSSFYPVDLNSSGACERLFREVMRTLARWIFCQQRGLHPSLRAAILFGHGENFSRGST